MNEKNIEISWIPDFILAGMDLGLLWDLTLFIDNYKFWFNKFMEMLKPKSELIIMFRGGDICFSLEMLVLEDKVNLVKIENN